MNIKLVGLLVTLFIIATGFASAWGMNASDVNTVKGKAMQIELKLDTHIKDNYEMHEELNDRLTQHDVSLVEQKVLLEGIDKSVTELKSDMKILLRRK